MKMDKNDTISLLKECDSGTKMAVSSIDEVMDKITDPEMKKMLNKSREHHAKLGNEIHSMLLSHHSDEKDPSLMAKSMSWIKTNMKITMDDSDAAIADLMTTGCDMGIKTLYRFLNQYQAADHASQEICHKLISIEEQFRRDLHQYL